VVVESSEVGGGELRSAVFELESVAIADDLIELPLAGTLVKVDVAEDLFLSSVPADLDIGFLLLRLRLRSLKAVRELKIVSEKIGY